MLHSVAVLAAAAATARCMLLLLLLLLLTHRCWAGCCWVVGPLGSDAPASLLVSLLKMTTINGAASSRKSEGAE
jgi:hypothetical protein